MTDDLGQGQDLGKVWTSRQLAEVGGVNRSRIRQLCIEGRFPGAFKLGNSWVIPDEDARVWLDSDRDRRRKRDQDQDEDHHHHQDQDQDDRLGGLAVLARRFVLERGRGHVEE